MTIWTLKDGTVNLYADKQLTDYLGRAVQSNGKWQVENREDKVLSVHESKEEAVRAMKKLFRNPK